MLTPDEVMSNLCWANPMNPEHHDGEDCNGDEFFHNRIFLTGRCGLGRLVGSVCLSDEPNMRQPPPPIC